MSSAKQHIRTISTTDQGEILDSNFCSYLGLDTIHIHYHNYQGQVSNDTVWKLRKKVIKQTLPPPASWTHLYCTCSMYGQFWKLRSADMKLSEQEGEPLFEGEAE